MAKKIEITEEATTAEVVTVTEQDFSISQTGY
jgi:hypothetical protein